MINCNPAGVENMFRDGEYDLLLLEITTKKKGVKRDFATTEEL